MADKSRNNRLEQQIDAYVKGDLSQEQMNELWVELLQNPEYISLLETEIDLARFYSAQESEKSSIGDYWKWIGAAAAVIALVISINIFSGSNQKNIQQWTEGTIDLSQNLATAPVTRSQSTITSSDSLLNAGFKAAVNGRTDQAMSIYHRIISRYRSPAILRKAYLNLGILTYNDGDFQESVRQFKHALAKSADQPLLTEQANWYMGNAYVNLTKLPLARAAILRAYHIGKIYKSEELNLLKRLDYKLGTIDKDDRKP